MKICLVIAKVTFKEIIRQPLFYIIICSGILLLLITSYLTLFTFGEEGRLIKDMGITTITLTGLIIVIFYAANSFSEKSKKAAAATVLCKAVNKSTFIIGKFLGTLLTLFLVYLILVSVFTLINSLYYDSDIPRQGVSSFKNVIDSMDCSFLLSAYLSFLQVLILTAICFLLSVSISSVVSNISICFTIYVLGHLGDYFYAYIEKSKGVILWLLKIIFILVPNLQIFDLGGVKLNSFQNHDSSIYLILVSFHTICYCSIMILFAIFFFQKRDML